MIRLLDNATPNHPHAHTALVTGDLFTDLRAIAAIVQAIQTQDKEHWDYAQSPYSRPHCLRYQQLTLFIKESSLGSKYFYVFEGKGPADWRPLSSVNVTIDNSPHYYAYQLLPIAKYAVEIDKLLEL